MKRLFDLIIITIFFPLLVLVFLVVMILVKSNLGSPVLFFQIRPGLAGKSFKMVKFRTMTDLCDTNGNLLPDSDRLTKFGKFLRSSSLDELPELWNVIKGEMSLVGPRPLLMEYLPLYNDKHFRRHEIRPGVTGWAQVNGRNSISWEEKFDLDVWYVDNHSLWLDLQILFLTVRKVIVSEGISANNDATMPGFTGIKNNNATDHE